MKPLRPKKLMNCYSKAISQQKNTSTSIWSHVSFTFFSPKIRTRGAAWKRLRCTTWSWCRRRISPGNRPTRRDSSSSNSPPPSSLSLTVWYIEYLCGYSVHFSAWIPPRAYTYYVLPFLPIVHHPTPDTPRALSACPLLSRVVMSRLVWSSASSCASYSSSGLIDRNPSASQ